MLRRGGSKGWGVVTMALYFFFQFAFCGAGLRRAGPLRGMIPLQLLHGFPPRLSPPPKGARVPYPYFHSYFASVTPKNGKFTTSTCELARVFGITRWTRTTRRCFGKKK